MKNNQDIQDAEAASSLILTSNLIFEGAQPPAGAIIYWELAHKSMIINFALWNTETNLPVAQNKSWVFQRHSTLLAALSASSFLQLIVPSAIIVDSIDTISSSHLLHCVYVHIGTIISLPKITITPLESDILVKTCPVDYSLNQ